MRPVSSMATDYCERERAVEAVNAQSSRQASALRQIWSSPLYRGATLAMFLSGLGTSAAAPQIVLFLVKEFDTPLPVAGLFYLTSLGVIFFHRIKMNP